LGKRKSTASTPGKQQQYDNAIKSLLEDREAQMLSHFLPGLVYQETLTIEVMRTPLRVDRVYKALYREKEHIVHIEFETGADSRMASRLLDYHTYFLHKYQLSVISIIIYPFSTTIATSPFEEIGSDGKPILTFHFIVLPLWKEKAQEYLEKHAIEMYSFLPTMEGANLALLSEAIAEMVEWYRNDQPRLVRELRWMGIMLRRANIVPLEDKQILERRLSMYDDLMEKDPKMQRLFAEREARGEAKGEVKGEVKGETKAARMMIVELVQMRFPLLTEQTQRRVNQLHAITELHILFRQLTLANDEQEARAVLASYRT